MADPATVLVRPEDGRFLDFANLGVRIMVWSEESGGGFSLIEQHIPPRTLSAPLHRHSAEDEYSYVLEGRLAALLGDELVYAAPGELVFKPRYQWHAAWNAGDEPCRMLETICPGGLELFYLELEDACKAGGGVDPTASGARYGLEFDVGATSALCAEHGITYRARS